MKAATLLVFLFSSSLAFQGQESRSAVDPVLRAMSDELRRSVAELQFKDLDKPYFVQYVVIDQERFRASATFGALTASDTTRVRYAQAQVRVGDYDFDNSEFVAGPGFQGAPPSGVTSQTVIDDDYGALRHALWLVTDASYKQAVEQLARKRAFVQNKVRGEQIPDFSKEAAVTVVGERRRQFDVDRKLWERQIREWSAIFRDFPAVAESNVTFEAQITHRYLVNSEGTQTMQPSMLTSIVPCGRIQPASPGNVYCRFGEASGRQPDRPACSARPRGGLFRPCPVHRAGLRGNVCARLGAESFGSATAALRATAGHNSQRTGRSHESHRAAAIPVGV
jgi:hypothetical protein